MIEIYTTAPESYDGHGTRTINIVGIDKYLKRDYRKVSVHNEHLEWQRERYYSGMHAAVMENEFKKLVEIGIIIPKDSNDTNKVF